MAKILANTEISGDFLVTGSLKYVSDMSGSYTNRSVIDLAYYNTQVASATASLVNYISVAPFKISNSIFYVSNDFGNDATAVRGDLNNPYQTVLAAITACSSYGGGLVWVFPGTYNSTGENWLVNGVNIHFCQGVTVNFYGFLNNEFNDSAGSVTARITGEAVINKFGYASLIYLTDGKSSDVHFECYKINATSQRLLYVFNGVLNFKCFEIIENFQYIAIVGQEDSNPGRTNGVLNFTAERVIDNTAAGAGTFGFYYSCYDGVGRTHRINIRYFESRTNSSIGAIEALYCSELCKIYFTGEIKNVRTSSSFIASIFASYYGGNTIVAQGKFTSKKGYVAQIFGNFDGALVTGTNAVIVIKNSFVMSESDGTGSDALSTVRCGNPNGFIKLIDCDIVGYTSRVIQSGINDSFGAGSSGNLELHNCRVQNLHPSNGYPIHIENSATLKLNNCILYSLSSYNAVYSSTLITMKVYGTSLANTSIGVNVTPQIGTFVVDPGVTLTSVIE